MNKEIKRAVQTVRYMLAGAVIATVLICVFTVVLAGVVYMTNTYGEVGGIISGGAAFGLLLGFICALIDLWS